MKKIIVTQDNKRAILDTKTDECIYNAPHNPPNTGTQYTRGADLYVHKSKAGQEFFYLYCWSMWQGDEARIEYLSKDEAMTYLTEHVDSYNGVDEEVLNRYGLLEETA